MQRRELLALVPAAATTAGCAAGYAGDDGSDEADPEVKYETLSLAEQGLPPTVCEEELRPGDIIAIGDPAFGPPGEWPEEPDDYRPLTDESTVIGLTSGERARAYPLALLDVHEIVNDEFGGPVIATYCPLCRSGMVAERTVEGTPTTFDVSGLLWKPPRINTAASEKEGGVFSDTEGGVRNSGNLVMYDGLTESYWSQMLARAICGPREESRLTIRPSTISTLGEWRTDYPDTEVLLPPPRSSVVDRPVTE